MANEADKKAPGEENRLVKYFRETRGELRKVTWPTRQEAWRLNAIVLGVMWVSAFFLWAVDALFSNAIRFLIESLVGL